MARRRRESTLAVLLPPPLPPPPPAATAACSRRSSSRLHLPSAPTPQGVESLDGLRLRLVDAKGQVVGRLASQIATILQVRPNGRKGCCAVLPSQALLLPHEPGALLSLF